MGLNYNFYGGLELFILKIGSVYCMIAGTITLISNRTDEAVSKKYYASKVRRQTIIDGWEKQYGFEKCYIHIEPITNEEGVDSKGLNCIRRRPITHSPCEDKKKRQRPPSEYSNRTPFNILKTDL